MAAARNFSLAFGLMTIINYRNLAFSMTLDHKYTHSRVTSTELPVIMYDNLQRESHIPYGFLPSVTRLQQPCKQTNTGTPNILMSETQ